MINNDSIVTAYDEHLTLVEWLQKVEVLLKNGGPKDIIVNDKGNATFSLTLVFNDGSKIESNAMTLASVNEALNNLTGDLNNTSQRMDDLEDEMDVLENKVQYHGFDLTQPFNKTNCVRIGTEFSTEEWTLKLSPDEIELSAEEANTARQILLKAIKYGFITFVIGSNNVYVTLAHAWEQTRESDPGIAATFVLNMGLYEAPAGFYYIYLKKVNGVWKYRCYNLEI